MPNAPTSNMGLVLPTEGSDAGEWDAYSNDAFERVDIHDHSSGLGVKVKTSGLDINADLSFASGGVYSAAKDLKAVDFQPHAASTMTAYAGALFVNSSDSNNLYFRTAAGSNVRITNGSSLDFTIAGGIGGDYAAIPAECNFVDSSKSYTFKSTTGGNWSRLQAGALRLTEFGTTETTYVELACPAALGGTYTITLPTAAPGSTSLVQMSSSGVLTASNTVGNAVSMSSTLGVTGLITATAGVTCAANQHVTISGTGEIKHGDRVLHLEPWGGFSNSATGTSAWQFIASGSIAGVKSLNGSGDQWYLPVPLIVGDRIKSIVFRHTGATSGLTGVAMDTRNLSTGVVTSSVASANAATSAYGTTTLSSVNLTLTSTLSATLRYSANSTSDVFCGASITYDHP